ncbi:hypothetical protein ARMGADRAFT_1078907 [Armillaria gallica]|uniref:Uncharacterized protein n=1 Tax=Armillaria gallica TaxID=47427 RepID=A0A2H3DG48_ARMGA|nr:hypothetical protein ARMGADRAFT_1078907 [Armillaria gallica]
MSLSLSTTTINHRNDNNGSGPMAWINADRKPLPSLPSTMRILSSLTITKYSGGNVTQSRSWSLGWVGIGGKARSNGQYKRPHVGGAFVVIESNQEPDKEIWKIRLHCGSPASFALVGSKFPAWVRDSAHLPVVDKNSLAYYSCAYDFITCGDLDGFVFTPLSWAAYTHGSEVSAPALMNIRVHGALDRRVPGNSGQSESWR